MAKVIDGRYELTQLISSGGMGSVWRGYDSVLDRPVAIKTIRVDQVVGAEAVEEFTERFRREARVTARIRHHGVPQVFDAVLDASLENVYLVMELIDGVALLDYIDPGAELPLSWVASVAAQVATVLSHAHALPVVHRDLKPANILVTRDGSVKVIDFGIAAILDRNVRRLTHTGQAIGTFRYMSPEAVHGLRLTPRADLYSLGCVIHEIVSGAPLFDTRSPYMIQVAHVEQPPTPLRELRPDIPAEFETLVLDLLEKQPQDRPTDAYTVYERLLPFLPAPGAETSVDAHLPGLPDPTRIFRRPNAPLESPRLDAPTLIISDADATAPLTAEHLNTAINQAWKRYNELLDDERFDQAADALAAILTNAAEDRGPDSAEVLGLRRAIAAAWALGGESRRARAELDSLAEAYRRLEGRHSAAAWEVRAISARCQMELGDIDGGLTALRAVLAEVVTADGDSSELALDLRRDLAELLGGTGDYVAALEILEPLHADLCVLRRPDDPLTEEVGGMRDELLAAAES